MNVIYGKDLFLKHFAPIIDFDNICIDIVQIEISLN